MPVGRLFAYDLRIESERRHLLPSLSDGCFAVPELLLVGFAVASSSRYDRRLAGLRVGVVVRGCRKLFPWVGVQNGWTDSGVARLVLALR